LNGPVILSVGDKQLRHRVDFGEFPRFSSPNGNTVKGELIVIRDGDEIDPSQLNDKVVLIPERPEQLDLAGTIKGEQEIGVLAMLIDGREPIWFVKGQNGSQKNQFQFFESEKMWHQN
jgi:hypothetical protein